MRTADGRKNDGVPLASVANCRLLSAVFFRSCDWEWSGGGCVQEHGETVFLIVGVKADGSVLEGAESQSHVVFVRVAL